MSKQEKESKGKGKFEVRTNKAGKIISYRIRASVGFDKETGKRVWVTKTLPADDSRLEGLTPKKKEDRASKILDAWFDEQKEAFEQNGVKTADNTKILFSEFVDEHWMPDHVKDGSHTPRTVDYFVYTSSNLKSYFGRKKLQDINTEVIKRYLKYLKTDAKTKTGTPYSQRTQQAHYSVLVNILRYAERMEYIKKDPTSKLTQREKPQGKTNRQIDFLAPEDAKRFIACLDQEYREASKAGSDRETYRRQFWCVYFNVMITTGLRRGECCGLEWADINETDMTITVQRNVTIDKNSETKRHIGSTKSGKSRIVPITGRVLEMLKELKKEQERRFGFRLMPKAFIFPSEDDPYLPIYPTVATMRLGEFIKRNDLPNVSPHDLRHTAASLALEAGANIKQIQQLLGHSDASTTMEFYTSLTEQAQRATVEGIESLIV